MTVRVKSMYALAQLSNDIFMYVLSIRSKNVLLTVDFYLAHEKHIFMLADICLFFVRADENKRIPYQGYFRILTANKWKIRSKNEVFCFTYQPSRVNVSWGREKYQIIP